MLREKKEERDENVPLLKGKRRDAALEMTVPFVAMITRQGRGVRPIEIKTRVREIQN
jgi:hypothetical protein